MQVGTLTHLLRRQVHRDTMQQAEDLVNERLVFPGLLKDKVAPALLSNFDEGVTSHILYTCRAKLGRVRN
jgi:hypothetical protein